MVASSQAFATSRNLPLPICIYRGRCCGRSRHMQWCHVTSGRQNVVTQGAVFYHYNLYLVFMLIVPSAPNYMHWHCLANVWPLNRHTVYKPEGSQGCWLSRAFCVSTFCLSNLAWNYHMQWDLSGFMYLHMNQILETVKIWKFGYVQGQWANRTVKRSSSHL